MDHSQNAYCYFNNEFILTVLRINESDNTYSLQKKKKSVWKQEIFSYFQKMFCQILPDMSDL